MRSTRAHFMLATIASSILFVTLLFTLVGYFRSVERGSSGLGSEKHLLAQMKVFHERLKASTGPEDAKAVLKILDTIPGLGQESDGAKEFKKIYSPVLAIFATKPREAETRYQLMKKRELMEALVNAYRKEVAHGDLRVRAAYLNVLFDTQNSLLNESSESEEVFIKRNRERLDGLKSIVGGMHDAGLVARVSAIDTIFQSYQRTFEMAEKWKAEKAETLATEENALPAIAKEIYKNEDSGADDSRRAFLYTCLISLLASVVGFLTLYLGFKVIKVRSDLKADGFISYLKVFGSESADPQVKENVRKLSEDPEWGVLMSEALQAEESFLVTCQSLLAIPRSLSAPYFVVSKDKSIRFWNESAEKLFGLSQGKECGVLDLIKPTVLRAREGDTETLLELLRAAVSSLTEDRFEIVIDINGTWVPYELVTASISGGNLAGGKVFFFKEVRSEAERVTRIVASQLERLKDVVHKVTHQYAVELKAEASDAPPVREMIKDLDAMKRKQDERELLWKTEIQALVDQVSRQQEILHKLGEELGRLRKDHGSALTMVREVHDGEELLHEEVCAMERDLERWVGSRKRLYSELQQQIITLGKVEKFEKQLREATSELKAELENYENDIAELRQFSEAARVHSVNLSLVRDPAYWEYAARTRAFSHELQRFTEKASGLGEKVKRFLTAHPGGALAAYLESPSLDHTVVDGIQEEQERTSLLLRRWKETGEGLIQEGEKVLTLLEEAEKKNAVLTQLGETSLLINQQAMGNLGRWS